MKQLILATICLCGTLESFSQQEKTSDKIINAMLFENYNQKQYDSIFALFSSAMQKALPLVKTREFFAGLYSQAGKIKSMEFMNYKQEFAAYKTNFERGIFTVNISVDSNKKISGLLIRPYTSETLSIIKRNVTKLALPFKDEWTIVWGGDTKSQNYHVENLAQKNAFDIIIKNEQNKSYKTTGKTNEDYYAFGKELLAPCDGEILLVVDGVKDNIPGEMNPVFLTGNTVIIKTTNNEYLFFAHFKQHNIKVKQGQLVKQGQVLGLCGNSGNSSEPHIHFHIQNIENMNAATGVKCYFDKLMVNGKLMTDYSPIQSDKVKPEK